MGSFDDLQKRLGKMGISNKDTLFDNSKSKHRIKTGHITSPTGSQTSAIAERRRMMYDTSSTPGDPLYETSRLSIDVGTRNWMLGGDGTSENEISTSLSVATDVWYLGISESILPFKGEGYQEDAKKVLEALGTFISTLDNVSPLVSIQAYNDLDKYFDIMNMKTKFDSEGSPRVIRLARFETWSLSKSTEFPSKGPGASVRKGLIATSETAIGTMYSGFMSFPVGHLGVMESLFIISESMLKDIHGFTCTTEEVLTGLMSPMNNNPYPGITIIDQGYIICDEDSEYPGADMADHDSIRPFYHLRYYLRSNNTWPIPGEFIGLLAQPFANHTWWFQKTSPILYAGNWIETDYYTSGIVVERMPPLDTFNYTFYKCTVRGVDICIPCSDFLEYNVGDRVAIIRLRDLGRFKDEAQGNFNWAELENLFTKTKELSKIPSNLAYAFDLSYLIVPVSFY